MFKDDIDLVREMIAKHGLKKPVVDLGGLRAKDITVADYDITIRTGDQRARYLKLNKDPFTDIVGEYAILNPEYGDPPIEQLSKNGHAGKYGTMVCLSTLEHMEHPFHAFEAFHELLQPGGLLILSTVFSFPVHGAPQDYWRFTPACLEMLAGYAALRILESGFRLQIFGDAGVRDIHTNAAQEIRSVYIVARK